MKFIYISQYNAKLVSVEIPWACAIEKVTLELRANTCILFSCRSVYDVLTKATGRSN